MDRLAVEGGGMNERLRIIGFTLAITIFFGGMVAVVNSLLKERIQRNRQVATQRAILVAFALANPNKPGTAEMVIADYARYIRESSAPDGTTAFARSDNPAHRAFLLKGDAYWGPLLGVMAVDAAAQQVLGIAFIDHTETPGLGARIDEPPFRGQFHGISYAIKASDGRRLAFVAPGTAKKANQEIDCITGATETSRAVERIMNRALDTFINKAGTP